MEDMLDELILIASKLPADVIAAIVDLGKLLLNTDDEEARRAAIDAAMAAADDEILRRSFLKGGP